MTYIECIEKLLKKNQEDAEKYLRLIDNVNSCGLFTDPENIGRFQEKYNEKYNKACRNIEVYSKMLDKLYVEDVFQ
jgi:hypothetical protein